jgi:hypothetical protein
MHGMAGFGMCISFTMAAEKVPTYGQLSLQFMYDFSHAKVFLLTDNYSLYILGIIGIIWVLMFHVTESTYFQEENTIAPHHVEEEVTINGLITKEQLEHERNKKKIAAGEFSSETAPKGGELVAVASVNV